MSLRLNLLHFRHSMMRLCRFYFYRIPTKSDIYANFLYKKDKQDNESTTVHSVTKVDSMEELNDLEKSLQDQSEYAALVKLK